MNPVNVKAQAPEDSIRRWAEWHEAFARKMMQSLRVGEPARDSDETRPVEERLLQAIWHDQLIRTEGLAAASGKRLEIIEPGRWNTGPGPDFLDARIRLAGAEITGDVEIHVQSVDWVRHRHHQDFAYNRVILHVVLASSDDRPYEEKQNGERLEQFVLEPHIDPDIETLRRSMNLDDYPYGRPEDLGLCHQEFTRLPHEELFDFMHTAGRARIEERIRRYQAQQASAGGFAQLVYQALMVAQGHKANKTLYFLLSKRAPIRELDDMARDVPRAERPLFYLAILLHVAQLFPTQANFLEETDDETRELVERLRGHWSMARPYFADRLLPPTKRWHSGMRPAGFPGRRLAAVSVLLTRLLDREDPLFLQFCARLKAHSFAGMKPAEVRKYWTKLAEPILVDEEEHYFARHFTLGGKPQRPQALLGEPAARSLIFNALLPLAALKGRQERDAELEASAWEHLARFPALDENSVSKFMRRRLLGDSEPDIKIFGVEIMQQALLKVFGDCCSHNERTCADCTFVALGQKIVQQG